MTVQIGPFWAASERFVIESDEESLVDELAARLVDLGRPGSDTAVDQTAANPDTVVFRIGRTGPRWMSHPWAVWRDGVACEQTVTDEYIVPYVLWEVTRLLLESVRFPLVPMHAAAVVHADHAIALIGPSHSGKSTLAASLTRAGWGFLTDEVSLLDASDPQRPLVHPFWRPIGVLRPGPLDAHITETSTDAEVLVPASSLGSLAPTAPLLALVCPTYRPGADGSIEPLAPAAALTMIADQLPSLARDGAEVFHALAAVVTDIPAFTMDVDDLDSATSALAVLVDSLVAAPGTTGVTGTVVEAT